jgi:hypothetical protein
MLRSLAAWLNNHPGLPTITRVIVGLLSLTALLCVLLGDLAARMGGLAALFLVLLGGALPLCADREMLRTELEMHKRLVSRYCKFIDELHPMYQVLAWEQVAYVLNTRGDTREYVTVRARVLRADLQLIRMVFGCGWEQPAKYRSKVKFAVRNILVGNVFGTSLKTTHEWVCNGKSDVIVHVPTPPRVGSEIRLLVIMQWPGKCAPLMAADNGVDDFVFKFVQQDVKHVVYRVILPAGSEAFHEPIGFTGEDSNFRIEATKDEDGRRQYVFEAFDLPILHRAGIRLELKGKDAHTLQKLAMNVTS